MSGDEKASAMAKSMPDPPAATRVDLIMQWISM